MEWIVAPSHAPLPLADIAQAIAGLNSIFIETITVVFNDQLNDSPWFFGE